jgi:cyanate lyase
MTVETRDIHTVFQSICQYPALPSILVYAASVKGSSTPPYIPGVRKLYSMIIKYGIKKKTVSHRTPGMEIRNPVRFRLLFNRNTACLS